MIEDAHYGDGGNLIDAIRARKADGMLVARAYLADLAAREAEERHLDELLSGDVLAQFMRFVLKIPSTVPLPMATPETDGHVLLEWYYTPEWVLSVSIAPNGTIAWASLTGDESQNGKCSVDQIDKQIWRLARLICGKQQKITTKGGAA